MTAPHMRRIQVGVLAVLIMLQTPPLLGSDKVKHFLMSFLVQSAGYSAARVTGMGRAPAQVVGATSVAAVGVAKELHDRAVKKGFSISDLMWDAAGGVAAASLLNGTR